jgi:hypothetical protein
VIHSTDKVINLLTDTGKLVSLVPQTIGNGPHNIVLPIDRFDSPVRPQTPANWSESEINLNGYEVELRTATAWKPEPDWPSIQTERFRIQAVVPPLLSELRSSSPDPGVLELLGEKRDARSSMEKHFVDALLEPSRLLISGLTQSDLDRALKGACAVAGVGTGLTPAGDDLLCGAMLACWAGFAGPNIIRDLPAIALEARLRTTTISAAYLDSASRGQFSVIWHRLLEDMIGDTERLPRTARDIIWIGHNSGAYTLAGFLLLARENSIE